MAIKFPDQIKNQSDKYPLVNAEDNQIAGLGFFTSTNDRDQLPRPKRTPSFIAVMALSGEDYLCQFTGDHLDPVEWALDRNWARIANEANVSHLLASGSVRYNGLSGSIGGWTNNIVGDFNQDGSVNVDDFLSFFVSYVNTSATSTRTSNTAVDRVSGHIGNTGAHLATWEFENYDGTNDFMLATTKAIDEQIDSKINTKDLFATNRTLSSNVSHTLSAGLTFRDTNSLGLLALSVGAVQIGGISYPMADGTANQVIATNGSGVLQFRNVDYSDVTGTPSLATVATSGAYSDLSGAPTIPSGDVVDDTTPQLGGDLDVNGNKIVSASNGDIVIDPNGTGAIILKSDDVRLEGTDTSVEVGTVKLYESDILGDNFVALKAPLSITSDVTFTLPAADGSDGQVLKTNGSGTLSFTDALDGVNDTLTGVTAIKDAGSTRGTVSFYDDAGDNFVALRGATTLTSDTVFILPTSDGSAGQFLKTDGSGNLSFAAAGGGSSTTFRQVHSMSFLDDMSTIKHYLPWKDINEQTTIYQEEAAMLMPYDGRIVSVTVRPATISGAGNLTIDVNTAPIGNNIFAPGSFTQEETEVLAVTATDDHHGFHFVFDNAQHFEAGDLCSIGIQASADLSSTTYWYVTTVVEFDTSADLGSSSTEHQQNP
jgi:hypothetical protein